MAKTKIVIDTTIKRYSKKKGPGCFTLGLGDVKLSEGQRNQLDNIIDDAAQIKLTIEPVQERLPGME